MFSLLYVDDEPGLLEVGKRFLELGSRFSVGTLTSAPEALEILGTRQYDAIISDYQMPEMDGIEFLKRVRASGNTVPFIIFTGRGREEIVIQALNEGADFYLQKGGDPVSQFAELAHKVQKAILQRRAEASIRDYERREADIINFLPDATFAIDTHGVVIAWNRAMELMTGVPSSEIIGKGNYEYAIPFYGKQRPILINLILDYDNSVARQYDAIKREGSTLFSEVFIPSMNGRHGLFLWFTASPLFNRDGTVIGAIESIRDITDRKGTESALRESEQRYRNVVEDQTEFICRFLPDGTHVFVNDAYCRYFQKKKDEIIGHHFQPQLLREDQEKVRALIDSLTPDDPVGFVRQRVIFPDKSVRWQHWVDRAIFNDKGDIQEYQSVGRDITDVMNAELAREESEQRYRNVVEDQTEFICRFRPDGTHVFVNDAYCRYFGIAREEIIGHRFRPDIPLEDRESMVRFFRTLTMDHPVDIIEHRIMMPDGSVRWQRWSDRAIFDSSGGVIEYQSVGRDTTEKKEAEKALRQKTEDLDSRNRLVSTLLDTIPIGIFMVEAPSGKPIIANREATRLLGRGILTDATEGNLAEVYDAYRAGITERYPAGEMPVIRGMYGESRHVDDMVVIRPDGTTVQLEVFGTPVTDGQNRVTASLVSFLDITERKRAEQVITEAQKKINLLTSLTRHDVANQIAVLRGLARIAMLKKSDPVIVDLLLKIDESATAIAQHVDFSRTYQELNMHTATWQKIREIVSKQKMDGISISCTCNIEIYADPMLERVFFNLIENAARHGEQVTVITVSCRPDPDGLVVTLEDNGIGVPPDLKETIFEKGYGKHTGFGLFLAREVLAITDISIRETGIRGQGARFEMIVPRGMFRFAS